MAMNQEQPQEFHRHPLTMDDLESKMLSNIINSDRRNQACSKKICSFLHTISEQFVKTDQKLTNSQK